MTTLILALLVLTSRFAAVPDTPPLYVASGPRTLSPCIPFFYVISRGPTDRLVHERNGRLKGNCTRPTYPSSLIPIDPESCSTATSMREPRPLLSHRETSLSSWPFVYPFWFGSGIFADSLLLLSSSLTSTGGILERFDGADSTGSGSGFGWAGGAAVVVGSSAS